MLIDLHSHELRYSPDSFQTLDEMTRKAASLGISGLCVTDHDDQGLAAEIGWESTHNGVRVFVGCEVYTFEGDILVFGAKSLPAERVSFSSLYETVRAQNGALIAAHPYRHNERGIKDGILSYARMLTAVEAYNGSTFTEDNHRAHRAARQMGLPVVGAGDSHVPEAVGRFVTRFENPVATVAELVGELKRGAYVPCRPGENGYEPMILPKERKIVG